MDPSIRSAGTFLNEDQRWVGNGGMPIGDNIDILLDRSGFDLVTAFPNRYIPAGVVLSKVTSTGLYIPYVGDSESVSIAVDATGGTFTITTQGQTTAAIAFNATATAVRTALELLGAIDPGDLVVTGGPGVAGGGTPYVLKWSGKYAGVDAPAVTTTATSLTGGGASAVVTTTAGGAGTPAGEDAALGLLFASAVADPNSTGDISAALFWSGVVIESKLPTGHGLDAAAKAALTHIKFV